jgi:hypothetical protein
VGCFSDSGCCSRGKLYRGTVMEWKHFWGIREMEIFNRIGGLGGGEWFEFDGVESKPAPSKS